MVYVMTLSVTQDCMVSNGRMIMNNGLEKMWKKGFPGQAFLNKVLILWVT